MRLEHPTACYVYDVVPLLGQRGCDQRFRKGVHPDSRVRGEKEDFQRRGAQPALAILPKTVSMISLCRSARLIVRPRARTRLAKSRDSPAATGTSCDSP